MPTLPRIIPHAPHQQLARNDTARAIYFCINRESRDVYLEKYTSNFDLLLECCGMICNNEDISPYVNLEQDILYWEMDHERPFSICRNYTLEWKYKLRHLAVDEKFLAYHSEHELGATADNPYAVFEDDEEQASKAQCPNDRMFEFEGLKTLIIVVSDVSDLYDEYQNRAEIDLEEVREEQAMQRDLDDQEMGFMGWEDKESFITWFANLME